MIADGIYCCLSKSRSVKEDIGPQGPVRDGREGQKNTMKPAQGQHKRNEAFCGFECKKAIQSF